VRDSTRPSCLGAVQRPTARPDPFVGSCARRFGLSGRPVLRWQGHAGPRPHLQARQRRPRQVRPGVYGFESLSPAPVRFAAEAVLTAYTLMAGGRGRGRRLQRHHRREMETLWSRWSPARHCRPPGGGSRDRRLRARRSGRGSQDRALPPHSSLPDGPACGRTPPVVKTRGGLKKLGDGH
jgi:hypothetical protein